MTIISPDEYDLLTSLSGQEQTRQAASIGKKYGLSSSQVLGMLPSHSTTSASTAISSVNTNLPSAVSHRFDYDPSPDASQRRQDITQAIMCPSCGVSMGIPAIRPIKVMCPQCSQEHTFLE